MIEGYLEQSIEKVYRQIVDDAKEKKVEDVLGKIFSSPNKVRLIRYYFSIIGNMDAFLVEGFFHNIRKHYGLQGLSFQYMAYLETNKPEIYEMFKKKDFSTVYFTFFRQNEPEKHLGGLFTRLVHYFYPSLYCPVEIQTKTYFGLGQDSYYIAMHILSTAYQRIIKRHPDWVQFIRSHISQLDEYDVFPDEHATDITVLDLYYRARALSH